MNALLFAEFREPERLTAAIAALRARGHGRLEAYTPYPVHGLDEALGARPSRLPWLVFAVGSSAAAAAYFLQWLLNAALYPLDAGGRPPHFPLSYVPITFEMGVLFAGFAAFAGVLAFGRLLRLWDPVFELDGFASASKDAYWLAVLPPATLDLAQLEHTLREAGATRLLPGDTP